MTATGISMSAFGAGSNGTLGVGIDVNTTVNALMALQRKPEDAMKAQIDSNSKAIAALQALNGELTTLSNSIFTLSDFVSGAFSLVSANSSDAGILTATANASASVGTHTVTVSELATRSSMYADPVNTNATLAAGTMSFTVGGVSKTVTINSSNNTLSGLAAAINADSSLGVTAAVLQGSNGSTLTLVSNTSGTAGAINVTSAPAIVTTISNSDGTTTSSNVAMSFKTGTTAKDASVTIDGVPFKQSSNTLTDVIPGVTIDLWSVGPSQTVSLNIAPDSANAVQGIQDFVNSYNSLINSVNQQFTVNPSTNSEGVLGSDSAVKTLQTTLLSMISYTTSDTSGMGNFRSFGLEMNNDGTLSINSHKLSSALQTNYEDVQSFFQDTEKGFAIVMNKTMLSLTSPTSGLLNVDIQGLTTTNQGLNNSIRDFEDRMTSIQERLTDEYNRINAAMEQFPALMQSLSEQLSSLQPTK